MKMKALRRFETSALAQKIVTSQKKRILSNTTVRTSNGCGATQPANSVGPPVCIGATLFLELADGKLGRIYAVYLRYELGEKNTHVLINIVIHLRSRTSSFRM